MLWLVEVPRGPPAQRFSYVAYCVVRVSKGPCEFNMINKGISAKTDNVIVYGKRMPESKVPDFIKENLPPSLKDTVVGYDVRRSALIVQDNSFGTITLRMQVLIIVPFALTSIVLFGDVIVPDYRKTALTFDMVIMTGLLLQCLWQRCSSNFWFVWSERWYSYPS